MLTLQHFQIEVVRRQMRDTEVEVAQALNDLFKQYYLSDIQKLVGALLAHILAIDEKRLNNVCFTGKKNKAPQYLCFQQRVKPSYQGLKDFSNLKATWTLEECSDMIRLFGECNEDWAPLGTSDDLLKEQQKLRPEPTFLKAGGSGPVYKDVLLTEKDGSLKRNKYGQLIVEREFLKGWGSDMGHRDRSEIPEDDRVKRGAPYTDIGPITRGVDKFKFEPKSVIAAIDRTFGLRPEGGDISGTTADSIYALRWAGSVPGSVSQDTLKAIQLLPLVTMVPQGHHTIVECGYPLSRWKYIDYHIGYYSSLKPINAGNRANELFTKVLDPFDKNRRGRHILAWGSGEREKAIEMETDKEIEAFRRATRVLSAYGFCVAGGLHNFDEALNYLHIFAPSLEAELKSSPDWVRMGLAA